MSFKGTYYRHVNKHRHIDKHRRTNRHDRQTDRQTDGEIDKQTNTHLFSQYNCLVKSGKRGAEAKSILDAAGSMQLLRARGAVRRGGGGEGGQHEEEEEEEESIF